jgi:hypothetical protein
MAAEFSIAPGNDNSLELGPNHVFVYGLPWGIDQPWSDDAVLRIAAEDGSQTKDFQKGDGEAIDDFFVFTFEDSRPDVLYTGTIVDDEIEFGLFGPVELWHLQDPADPSSDLPLPEGADGYGDDAAPDSDAPDSDAPDSDAPDSNAADAQSSDDANDAIGDAIAVGVADAIADAVAVADAVEDAGAGAVDDGLPSSNSNDDSSSDAGSDPPSSEG